MAQSETGTQLLARLGARPSLSGLEPMLFGEGPEPCSVYELYGGEGVGKTEMTLLLMAKCLLPKVWNQLEINGKDTGIILIDTEYKFPIFRLAEIMDHQIKSATMSCDSLDKESKNDKKEDPETNLPVFPSDEAVEDLIQNCLKKLYILQCDSLFHLLMTLNSLDSLLSSNPNISLLIIDTISAFYWIEKSKFSDRDMYQGQEKVMRPIISVLLDYVNNYKIIVICVKSALIIKKSGKVDWNKGNNSPADFNQGREPSVQDHTEFLGNSWTKFVTHRFIFNKASVTTDPTFTLTCNNWSKKSPINYKIGDCGIHFTS